MGVLEAGKRFEDDDFAKSTWRTRSTSGRPRLGLRGILRMYVFKDVAILSRLRRRRRQPRLREHALRAAARRSSRRRRVARARGLGGGPRAALRRGQADARRGRGPLRDGGRPPLPRARRRHGRRATGARRSASSSASPARPCPTPTSAARAPTAPAASAAAHAWSAAGTTPRTRCARTTSGSPSSCGTEIRPERHVIDIRPLGAPDGSDGYEVTSVRPGAWVRKRRETLTARGVVVSAGAIGIELAARATARTAARSRSSPTASARSSAPTARRCSRSRRSEDTHDFHRSVAITSSIYPDEVTHIENVTYGEAGDAMGLLFTMLTEGGTRAHAAAALARPGRRPPDPRSCACCGSAAGRSAPSSCSSCRRSTTRCG